jgi:alpha 1,3-glucosidase
VFNARGLFNFEYEKDAPAAGESWSETFNSHTDSRPKGPTALAFDVAFPGAHHVYGIPERATSLSLRDTKNGDGAAVSEPYRLYNLDVFEYLHESPFGLYGSIPMLVAHSAGGGGGGLFGGKKAGPVTSAVYFNNPTEAYVDVAKKAGEGTHSHWMAESGAMDLFFIPGPTAPAVLRQYTALTGTTQMPPQFALGYHQCRWNYRDEDDVAKVDAGFDEHDIPYDVLWLDIEHTDGKRYMTWDKTVFPTPKRMIDDVASRGRKMVTIVDPHVKKDASYPIYKEAEQKKFYVQKPDGSDFDGWCWPGSSAYLDVTSPKVRDWWAGKFSLDSYQGSTKDLYIWNDMNEPSVFNGPEVTMQKDLKHHGGVEHREVHNAFGMYYHAATADGIRRRNDERPFVLSRAFFAGTQRVGPIWTGDNAADWDHLRVSLPMVMTLGLTGLTFSGADVGGFFGNPDAELMTRWYQLGIYYPFFRGHAHLDTKRREPWLFGDESTGLIRAAIRRRYQLMPYLYTLFEAAHREGAAVARPLWSEFPADADTLDKEDAMMLGPALLVHPVLHPGAKEVSVYLPAGVWYDMDTNAKHTGPKAFKYPVTMADTPTFVRGGHIIVRRDRSRRSTAAMAADPFTVVVAPDEAGNAVGEVYLDDGKTFHYQKGAFARRALTFTAFGTLECSAPVAGLYKSSSADP